MKLAITGKGGVGKTTIVALLARILHDKGYKVLLIDADPDMNLASVLGVPKDTPITPIIEMRELIAERTGAEIGQPAPFFKMNPKVDDIPDKFCIEHRGLKLMVMGSIRMGGAGCACPENAFLRSLLSYMVVLRNECVLLDMEAGIEHLGRGTAIGVDSMIIVVEPNNTSIETAYRIKKLSADVGIKNITVIGNKIQNEDEKEFIQYQLKEFPILGFIENSDIIKKMSVSNISSLDLDPIHLGAIENIFNSLLNITQKV